MLNQSQELSLRRERIQHARLLLKKIREVPQDLTLVQDLEDALITLDGPWNGPIDRAFIDQEDIFFNFNGSMGLNIPEYKGTGKIVGINTANYHNPNSPHPIMYLVITDRKMGEWSAISALPGQLRPITSINE